MSTAAGPDGGAASGHGALATLALLVGLLLLLLELEGLLVGLGLLPVAVLDRHAAERVDDAVKVVAAALALDGGGAGVVDDADGRAVGNLGVGLFDALAQLLGLVGLAALLALLAAAAALLVVGVGVAGAAAATGAGRGLARVA